MEDTQFAESASNISSYETTELHVVYNLLDSYGYESEALECVAQKAYVIAQKFKEEMTTEVVLKYLNGQLPYDALSQISLMVNPLHGDEYLFSYSHARWLRKLNYLKHIWSWNISEQNEKVTCLMKKLHDLQELALSLPTLNIEKTNQTHLLKIESELNELILSCPTQEHS